MKKNVFYFLGISLLMFAMSSCTVQSTESKEKTAAYVKAALENKEYTINVNRVHPMGGRSFTPTSPYSVTIKGDSVYSYLPYFGRAYSATFGGGEGLIFNAPYTNYKTEKGKKDVESIKFNTRSQDDSFEYRIEIFPNGSTMIIVQPNNKQGITFDGVLAIKDK